MADNKTALKKAATIARIHLTPEEEDKLVGEIDDVLKVFSKIDAFKEYVEVTAATEKRNFRVDKPEKCKFDPFSNTKLVERRKFLAPKLVD